MPSKPRKKKASTSPAEQPDGFTSAESIKEESLEYLCHPWLSMASLGLVVGEPGVGKSTFASFLIREAGRAVVLPGKEESLAMATIPRWRTNGVQLRNVLIGNGRDYRFPRDRQKIANVILSHKARLLLMDPIDSYYDDSVSENDGAAVRNYLESLAWIAEQTGASVVGVRHPGKDRDNPLPGSRQWRAVPRSIVLLKKSSDDEGGYFCAHFKDPAGNHSPPRKYSLKGDAIGEPKRFEWEQWITRSAEQLQQEAPDRSARGKVLDACKLIAHMFSQEEAPSVQDLVNQCRVLGIGEHARDTAKNLLKVQSYPTGTGATWAMRRLVSEWPEWLKEQIGK